MKRQFYKKTSLRLLYFNLMLALVPAVLWAIATVARPWVIEPRCGRAPQLCDPGKIFPIDQLSLNMESWKADLYSFRTQNFSGVLAFTVPAVWHAGLFTLGRVSGPLALVAVGSDLITVSQTVAWNGVFTEISHLISQRARPFVYIDPAVRGTDSAHYTSFYSGHTSFTATCVFALFLILLKRGAPLGILYMFAALGEGLIVSTAYFRILAGRHFLTDVIFGAIAGLTVAWGVYYLDKRSQSKNAV